MGSTSLVSGVISLPRPSDFGFSSFSLASAAEVIG
jgi:hypothetical protein